jgi:hypothetical protein
MTSLPEYLTEFKSKVERRLGTVVDEDILKFKEAV